MAQRDDLQIAEDARMARARAIIDAEGPRIQALVSAAVALAMMAPRSPESRAASFLQIADELSRTIVPHTVCRDGCSHCCFMATCLSGEEARIIGRYVGRAPRVLGRERVADLGLDDALRARYTGVRCVFLDANRRCSIYPVRPIACRLHHSIEASAEPCRIEPPNIGAPVAHINLTAVEVAVSIGLLDDDFGDIREFFPT